MFHTVLYGFGVWLITEIHDSVAMLSVGRCSYGGKYGRISFIRSVCTWEFFCRSQGGGVGCGAERSREKNTSSAESARRFWVNSSSSIRTESSQLSISPVGLTRPFLSRSDRGRCNVGPHLMSVYYRPKYSAVFLPTWSIILSLARDRRTPSPSLTSHARASLSTDIISFM